MHMYVFVTSELWPNHPIVFHTSQYMVVNMKFSNCLSLMVTKQFRNNSLINYTSS